MGLAGICARPTPELLRLQADVIAAAAPFMAPTGPIEAFTARHDNPAFDAALIDYVAGFVDHHAGAHFNPHVTTGVAPTDYLDRMIAEPFPRLRLLQQAPPFSSWVPSERPRGCSSAGT